MFKSIIKSSSIQPILTVILVGVLAVLIFQFSSKSNKPSETLKEIAREVSFEEASNKFLTSSLQVYTRGSVFSKGKDEVLPTPTEDPENPVTQTPIPTPTNTKIQIAENKYNDIFFLIQNSAVKRIDTDSFGKSDSRFFNDKSELVLLNNTDKIYKTYASPSPDDKDNSILYRSTQELFNEFFPLIPLLKEYKEGKFNPVERSYNLYSGKWQHPFFTSGEVTDVFLETDPTSGIFRSITIVHTFTKTQSRIFFDFKQKEINLDTYKIPQGYTKTEEEKKE